MKIDIFTVNDDEAENLLAQMKRGGYETVIGDVICCKTAKLMGITPILLVTNFQTLTKAIDNSISAHRRHAEQPEFAQLDGLRNSHGERKEGYHAR